MYLNIPFEFATTLHLTGSTSGPSSADDRAIEGSSSSNSASSGSDVGEGEEKAVSSSLRCKLGKKGSFSSPDEEDSSKDDSLSLSPSSD